jgi:hypothetical protein
MTPKPTQVHPVEELPPLLLDVLVARSLWPGLDLVLNGGRLWITHHGVTRSFSPSTCLADTLFAADLAPIKVPVLPQPAELRSAVLGYLRTLHGDTYEYDTADCHVIFELL